MFMNNPSHSLVRIGKQALIAASILTLAACSSSDDDNDSVVTPVVGTSFIFSLSSDESVPPLMVDGATGEANLLIDDATGDISGSVAVSGLTGQATMAHIHTGFAGSTGPVIVGLTGNETGTLWSVNEGEQLNADGLAALATGSLYVNIHTEANPAGEIRGQIVPEGIEVLRSVLSGDQEVPVVITTASATAVATVDSASGAINATIFTTGVDDATMAHIHQAAAGSNGGVIQGMTQVVDVPGAWRTAADAMLEPDQLEDFNNGGLYYNVHTPANPGGELRGQLVGPEGSVNPAARTFTVRIDNVSAGDTLPTPSDGGSVGVPLSPGAYLVHTDLVNNPMLEPRAPASMALEALAEDGNASLFPDFLAGSTAFNTPVGASDPGPLLPGAGTFYEFSFTAAPGDQLALATMFVQSNDWFYTTTDADNDSIALFDTDGTPVSGDVSDAFTLWQSGTEVDEEPGTGPNQAPRQSEANTGTPETRSVASLASEGITVNLNGPVIQVTLSVN